MSTNITIQKLLKFLNGKPTAYINEIQDFLFNKFNIQTSRSTIRRIFQATHWSRKAVFKRIAQHSTPLCSTWQGKQKQWFTDQLVFLNKSAANKKTNDRK